MTYTAAEKHADAAREVRLRQKVYDRLVNANSMSMEAAKRRIAIMTEIAEDYRQLAKKERLFDDEPIPSARTKAYRSDHRAARDAGPDRTGETAAAEAVETGPAKIDQG